MTKALRSMLAVVLAMFAALTTAGVARADLSNSSATNAQSGSNRSTANQRGTSKSGDSVGGQVVGVVSSGRTSVDARNTSTDSDVTSGDASGSNHASAFTGLNTTGGGTSVTADITGVTGARNLQDGDNRSTLTQSVAATTGDGVAGEVIGVVTGAGGSASIVAANTSTNDSVETGDADGANNSAAFTGLNDSARSDTLVTADITNSCTTIGGCLNVQDGSNRSTGRQSATASTGDGVAGQVIGGVSSGRLSIDARNTSDNVDVTTGDAKATNDEAVFTGLNSTSGTTTVSAADVTGSCNVGFGCNNVQDGRNRATTNQSSNATSGDGVGGQVIGAVTSAGGSASIVAANTTTNSDVETGDATSHNGLSAFVGLNDSAGTTTVQAADVTTSCTSAVGCGNVQDGNNTLTGSQSATSHTGDGVAGQVLGVVAAGATSVDANNKTDDSSVETGNSKATNAADEFVGLDNSRTTLVGASDISGANAVNLQDGTNRKTLSQTADASSGDAVAGEVAGVVTSAGGSASVVLANTSTDIDSQSGETTFNNDEAGFVGLNFGGGPIVVH